MDIREKYSLDNKVTLYQGDCMDLFKDIPNETCDLIITSPPYCIGKAYEDKKETYRRLLNNRKKQLKKYIEFSRLEEVFAGKWGIILQIKK